MATSTQFGTTLVTLYLFLFQYLTGSYSATLTIANKCNYTVWAGISSGAVGSPLSTTGFSLQPSETNTIAVPLTWSGRLWGRTLCSHDSTGNFSCVTGDCSSSTVECAGSNATPPVTLAEFDLNGTGGLDLFEVSLVNGYNLPMTVEPRGGNCTATGCVVDLNAACPTELKAMGGRYCVGCMSACQAFGDSKYCCSGAYETCKPSFYSEFFKSACPRANVDGTSNFTCACASANYLIIFCPTPSPSSIKSGHKKYTKAVDNSGGQVDGSTKNNVIAVAVVVATIICGLLACKIRFSCSRRDCGIEVVAGTRSETSDPGPQSVTV